MERPRPKPLLHELSASTIDINAQIGHAASRNDRDAVYDLNVRKATVVVALLKERERMIEANEPVTSPSVSMVLHPLESLHTFSQNEVRLVFGHAGNRIVGIRFNTLIAAGGISFEEAKKLVSHSKKQEEPDDAFLQRTVREIDTIDRSIGRLRQKSQNPNDLRSLKSDLLVRILQLWKKDPQELQLSVKDMRERDLETVKVFVGEGQNKRSIIVPTVFAKEETKREIDRLLS